MLQKTIKITGWVLIGILSCMFTMSAFLKLSQHEMAQAQALSIGVSASTYFIIGIVEVISLTLFLIPRTALLGTLLLIAYMGGAIVTHLQHNQSMSIAIFVQVLIWISAIIRFPELTQRLVGKNKTLK